MFRDATHDDRSNFLRLWVAMLEEIQQYDCPYQPDLETMHDVAALFDAYVSGVVFGCVVLYEPPGEVPQGVAMIGESGGMPTIRSTSRGKTAHLWGIYMQPDHRTKRIGYHLMQASYKRLREMHFETMVSEVATSNATALAGVVAIGCSPTAIVHTIALGDCYGRDKRE